MVRYTHKKGIKKKKTHQSWATNHRRTKTGNEEKRHTKQINNIKQNGCKSKPLIITLKINKSNAPT